MEITPKPEAVKRVAAAINLARYTPGGLAPIPLDQEDERSREYAYRLARAAITALRSDAPDVEQLQQAISAWAFAHNIDGAARNDLMRRVAILSTPTGLEAENERGELDIGLCTVDGRDERIKQLMGQVGHQNSMSLYQAFCQLHQETLAAATQASEAENERRGGRTKSCSCAEVYGEDPRCFRHGEGTEWRKQNPDICELAEKAARAEASEANLAEAVDALRREVETTRARWIANIQLHGLPKDPKRYQDAVHCYFNGILDRLTKLDPQPEKGL